MVKNKLTKHERLQVTYAIEDILDGYCRAECPHFGLNIPSTVCGTCPAGVRLQEHGSKLWSEDELKPVIKNPWTLKDDRFLMKSRDKMKLVDIAKKLGRTISDINIRVKHLKDKGLI